MKNKFIAPFVLSLFFFVFIGFTYSQTSTPILPAVYKGKITSDSCGIVGLSIIGKIDNVKRGETTIYCTSSNECWYGSIKNINNADLVIDGYDGENNIKTIDFYICNYDKCVKVSSDLFVSGNVKIMNFSLTDSDCSVLFPSSGGGREENITILDNQSQESSTERSIEDKLLGEIHDSSYMNDRKIISLLDAEGLYSLLSKEGLTEKDVLNVTIKEEFVFILNNTLMQDVAKKQNVFNEIINSVSLNKKIGENKSIEVNTFSDIEVRIKLIEIIDKEGNKKNYTKIEKKILTNIGSVVEVVPKDMAPSMNDIVIVKGSLLNVIKDDPMFEIKPESSEYSYIVKGDKKAYVNKTVTLYYSINEVEKLNKTTIVESTLNGGKGISKITLVFLVIILILVLSGMLYYYKVYLRK